MVEKDSYFASIAVAIATGPIGGIGHMWADILHTADWHIGQTLNGRSRDHEHRA